MEKGHGFLIGTGLLIISWMMVVSVSTLAMNSSLDLISWGGAQLELVFKCLVEFVKVDVVKIRDRSGG